MYGAGVGTIRVLVQSESRSTEMWRSRGNQGNKWIQAVVPIGHIGTEFQIEFVGTRSFSVLGDIAIDDIQYLNCAYPRKPSNRVKYLSINLELEIFGIDGDKISIWNEQCE